MEEFVTGSQTPHGTKTVPWVFSARASIEQSLGSLTTAVLLHMLQARASLD